MVSHLSSDHMKKIDELLASLEKHIEKMKKTGREIPAHLAEKLRELADRID